MMWRACFAVRIAQWGELGGFGAFSDLGPGHVCALVLLDVAPVLSIFSQVTFLLLLWGACPASLPFRLSPRLLLAASVCPSLLFRTPGYLCSANPASRTRKSKPSFAPPHLQNPSNQSPQSELFFFSETKTFTRCLFLNHILTPIFIPTIRFPFAPRHPFSLPSHLHKKSFLLFPIHHSTSRFSKTKNPQTTTQPILPKNHQDQQPPPLTLTLIPPSYQKKKSSPTVNPTPLPPLLLLTLVRQQALLVCKNGKSGSWAGYRDLVSFWNWENGGRGDLVVQGSEKRGELGGCRCEGDEIVGRIRVGAGERGGVFCG